MADLRYHEDENRCLSLMLSDFSNGVPFATIITFTSPFRIILTTAITYESGFIFFIHVLVGPESAYLMGFQFSKAL